MVTPLCGTMPCKTEWGRSLYYVVERLSGYIIVKEKEEGTCYLYLKRINR